MLELIKAPDPKLRVKTKPVKKTSASLLQILKEMVKLTKTFQDPEGVGLASTQIGLNERFFVAKDNENFIMVINPKIISSSKQTKTYFEGCLSTPNIWGEVKRHLRINVSYLDEKGITKTIILKGLLAHIFQHEIDHLNGILFQDRVLAQKGSFYKFTGKDKAGSDIYEEITL